VARGRGAVALLALLSVLVASPPPARCGPGRGGGADSQIDESAPDEAAAAPEAAPGPADLPGRVREYVAASLAKYDDAKSAAAGFRRQGWYPSFFLRDPSQDVLVESGGGATAVTVHLSCARRDVEQRIVVGPAERFFLPGADRRFFTELLAALATAAPEIAHARLRLWFGVLRGDGGMTWEDRGTLALAASVARRFPAGARTPEALWPLLEENSVSPALWPK
jgi:hypothetical protein